MVLYRLQRLAAILYERTGREADACQLMPISNYRNVMVGIDFSRQRSRKTDDLWFDRHSETLLFVSSVHKKKQGGTDLHGHRNNQIIQLKWSTACLFLCNRAVLFSAFLVIITVYVVLSK